MASRQLIQVKIMDKYSNIPESVLRRLSEFIKQAGHEINPNSIFFIADSLYVDETDEIAEEDEEDDSSYSDWDDWPYIEGKPGYLTKKISGGFWDDPNCIEVTFYDEDEILYADVSEMPLWKAIDIKQFEIRLKHAKPYIQELVANQHTKPLYGEFQSNLYFDICYVWHELFGYTLMCYERRPLDIDDPYENYRARYHPDEEIVFVTSLSPQQIAAQDKKNQVHFLPQEQTS